MSEKDSTDIIKDIFIKNGKFVGEDVLVEGQVVLKCCFCGCGTCFKTESPMLLSDALKYAHDKAEVLFFKFGVDDTDLVCDSCLGKGTKDLLCGSYDGN